MEILKLCKICLEKTSSISIFGKGEDSIQFSDKLMRVLNVREENIQAGMMCEQCVSELNIAYKFVLKYEASGQTLRCLNSSVHLYSNFETKGEAVCDIKDEVIDSIKGEELSEDYDYATDFSNDLLSELHSVTICNNVVEVTQTQESVKKKVRKKCGKNRVQCVTCGLITTSPSALEIHMRKHTGERPFSCDLCFSKFPTKGALKRHLEVYHSKNRERKFTCETCGKSFFRKNDIIIHIRIHTDEKPFSCKYCLKKFKQITSRNRHQRIHTGEKPYECVKCKKKFGDKQLLSKHQSVHSDERKFACQLCNKSMKSKGALKVHMHLHSNEKKSVCSVCGMTYSNKGNLMIHMKRIHSDKSGECSICSKTFSDLEGHMRKHTGEKPFCCNICSASYAFQRSLTHHMFHKHQNAQKFKCSVGECTKMFPTANMLEFHLLKQHTNHTPYICQHCSRGFFRTSDLSRHLRISHMDVQLKSLKSINKALLATTQ